MVHDKNLCRTVLPPRHKGGRAMHGGICGRWRGACRSRLFHGTLFAFSFCCFLAPFFLLAHYSSAYIGISLSELQAALSKVSGPVTLTPRPGSDQGTLEAKLAENAGVVQAAGSPGNLSVVILWLPIDRGKFAHGSSRRYLEAFVQLLNTDSQPIVRWTEQVLERAVAASRSAPYLESQLFEERQFKVTYTPMLSPPMLSLTVMGGGQGAPR